MTADIFAKNEFRDFTAYHELEKNETNEEFKKILAHLKEHEWGHYQFWLQFSKQKKHHVSNIHIIWWRFVRRVLGLTFLAKYLEHHEATSLAAYKTFLQTADPQTKKRIQQIIDDEAAHEQDIIGQIQEEKVAFMSSIVLGLNDGLIELTGALVGFSFALSTNRFIAASGLITGIAASMSMAASAYMQAKHEKGKDPKKASLYTGVAYVTVVTLLILPFLLLSSTWAALSVMGVIILIIISGMSFYSATLFERNFWKQWQEMFLFSVGIACVTFLLGSAIEWWINQ